jgi:hypothetical protein
VIPRVCRLTLLLAATAGLATSGEEPSSLRAFVAQSQSRQAFGIYASQRKIGWAIDELKLARRDGVERAVQITTVELRLKAGGQESSFAQRTTNWFELSGQGELVCGDEERIEDKSRTRMAATRKGDDMVITVVSGQTRSTRRVPKPRVTLARMQAYQDWLRKDPARGARFEDYDLDWAADDIDIKQVDTFEGRKTVLWGGLKTVVCELSVLSRGLVRRTEVTTDGLVIKDQFAGLFEMRAEEESLAKRPGGELVDLHVATAIPADRELGEGEKIDALTVQLSAPREYALPVSPRQRIVRRTNDSLVVEILRDRPDGLGAPLSAAQRGEALKATSAIQSDDKTIRKLARQIVGKGKDPVAQANLLEQWVFNHLRRRMGINALTARDVLANKAGDCTEHTILFVSLARSIGLPAREIYGIMYLQGEKPVFGWHAWAEIYDGRQWVSVDPTWNQVRVDATHLQLAEHPDDLGWIGLLGQTQIKIVNFLVLKKDDRIMKP